MKGWYHVDTDSSESSTPLAMQDVIKALINAGANINKPNGLGDTPLHIAILRRDLDAIQYLIQNGASLNAFNIKAESPIDMLQKSYSDMTLYVSKAMVLTLPQQKEW